MREDAKAKNLPPRYNGKWSSASQAEVDAELEKGTPYTYRFRVPQEGSVTIHDLIRGEVRTAFICKFSCSILSFIGAFIQVVSGIDPGLMEKGHSR